MTPAELYLAARRAAGEAPPVPPEGVLMTVVEAITLECWPVVERGIEQLGMTDEPPAAAP